MNKVKNKLTKVAIKTSQLGFCLAVMASANVFASSSADLALTETDAGAAESETTYELNGRTISVTISETNGLTVADSKNILASQKGHFVAAGNYLVSNESVGELNAEVASNNGAYIQTLVFEINSQQIRSYTIGIKNAPNHAISITQTSATDVKDSEALCSAKIDGKLQFINIDALGMLTQYLAVPNKNSSALTVHPLRTLAIGPGIKSCALGVSDHAPNFTASDSNVSDAETSHVRTKHVEKTIYLADEYAGVWAMPADEEAEVERTLIFNQPDTPVEGVATLNGVEAHKVLPASLVTSSPDTNSSAAISSRTNSPATTILGTKDTVTAWVSPEHSGLWLHNTCATSFFAFDKDIAPEDIALWVKGDTVHANIYDDNSGSTLTTDITHVIATLNRCHTNQASLTKTPTYFNETPMLKGTGLTTETPTQNGDVSTNITNETPMLSAIELQPIYETNVVENYGDAADDPAIWVNKNIPSKSVIIGTNKKGSLNTYNLQGELVASHKVGRVNNVGVAYDWAPQHDIAVASNRSSNSMSVFFIDKKTGKLTFNTNIPTPLNDIYGLCVFSINNHTQVLVNSTDGRYLRYLLNAPTNVNSHATAKTNTDTHPPHTNNASKTEKAEPSQVSATLIHDFELPSQPEGCVVDTNAQIAYLGEESAGIWALDVSEIKTMPLSTLAKTENKHAFNKLINKTPTFIIPIETPVTADIEGLSLFDVDGVRYLIASSQGNNQYAVYEVKAPYGLVGMISIGANYDKGIDGVSETDGLETTNANLGGPFKNGLLVVQDGRNVMPSQRQNFKLVTGDDLADAIRSHVRNRSQ